MARKFGWKCSEYESRVQSKVGRTKTKSWYQFKHCFCFLECSRNGFVVPLSQNLDHSNRSCSKKMHMLLNDRLIGGGASTLEQPRLESGFVSQSYDSLDDLENEGTMAIPEFGLDDYSFGQGL